MTNTFKQAVLDYEYRHLRRGQEQFSTWKARIAADDLKWHQYTESGWPYLLLNPKHYTSLASLLVQLNDQGKLKLVTTVDPTTSMYWHILIFATEEDAILVKLSIPTHEDNDEV